jgi:predicted P-loop ATPase
VLPDGRLELFDLEGVLGHIENGFFVPAASPAREPMRTQTTTQERSQRGGELTKVPKAEVLACVKETYAPTFDLRRMVLLVRGVPFTEQRLEAFHLEAAQKDGLDFRKGDLQSALLAVAWDSRFDPVERFLSTINRERESVLSDDEWNRIAELCFGLEDDFARKVLQKWFVATVARPMKPGCKVDFCLILHGKQGTGKSTFFQDIAGEFFTDSMGDLSDAKDDLMVMHRGWISEWAEAEQVFVGANKAEKLKRFISASSDTFRVPYGRAPVEQPRRGVLVGTTNRKDWASDPTGNRRFPVLEVQTVNREWIRANRKRILGRALAELGDGMQWWFTAEEEHQVSVVAQGYGALDDDVEQCWEFLQGTGKGQWWSTRELMRRVLLMDAEACSARAIASMTRRLMVLVTRGCVHKRKTHADKHDLARPRITCECWAFGL